MKKAIFTILILLSSVTSLLAEREMTLKATVNVSGKSVLLEDLVIETELLTDEEKKLAILESPLRGFKNFLPVNIAFAMQAHKSLWDISLIPPKFVKVVRVKDANFVTDVKEAVVKYLSKETPWKMFEIEVEFSASDLAKINEMSGSKFVVTSQRANDQLTSSKVNIKFTENDVDRGEVIINPDIRRKILAITLKSDLKRGDTIRKSDLVLGRVWADGKEARYVSNFKDCVGFEVAQDMSAGKRIAKSFLHEPVYVRKGQELNVSYNSPGIDVSMRAVAMTDGRRGDFIKVKNIDSEEVFEVEMAGIKWAIRK